MRRLLCLSAVALLGCPANEPAAAPPDAGSAASAPMMMVVATCAELNGSGQVRRGGKPFWEPLAQGSTLRDGDWVRTGPGSTARIELLAGGTLELGPNAVVVIELPPEALDAGKASPPQVAVESGEVRATPAPPKDGDEELAPLVLRSKNGKTTVLQSRKGPERTTFRLSATEQGTEVAVMRGSGELRSGTQTLTLESGSSAHVGGEGPMTAVELPDFPPSLAPGIDTRLQFEADAGVRLSWGAIEEATGYRVQIAGDLSFTVNPRSFDVTEPGFSLKPDAKGLYVWRVATRTKATVGEFGFARRIFFELDEPTELLLGPEDGFTVSYASALPLIAFSWQGSTGNPSYRLLISRDSDPRVEPVVSLVTTVQQAEVSSLSAGEYHWGTYLEGKELKPLFLKARTLVVKSVPRAVVKTPKSVSDWQ